MVLHQLEDIIDEYAHLVREQNRRGFYGSLHRTFGHCKDIKAWHGIRKKLQEVEGILDDLKLQKERYGIPEGTTDDSAGRHQHGKQPPYFPDEGEVVGFQTYKNLLVGWLTDEEPLRTIISVWGMGGLGKTTLVPIETVPDEVAILFNLRYLGLRRTLVKELPRSLGRLRNLQTLDLYDSKIEKLPHGITQLKNLRHLFVESIRDPVFAELASDPGVKAPKGIWNLKNLQALQSVEADEDMVRHLGNLTQLRTLRITRVRGMHSVELCSSISKMSRLVSLDIVASNEGEALQLEALKPPPFLYQKLDLRGQLEHGVLPHWFSSLNGLRQLGLSWSKLREDTLPCLHELPNLAILGMYNAYDGQELCFHAGGFPKLKFLMLGGSNQLDSISMEEGALPSLSELCLLRCGGMKLLPQGIEHLTSLQVLYLMEMPVEFIQRMRGGNGNMEERRKVQHIPLIKHVFPSGGKWTAETLS